MANSCSLTCNVKDSKGQVKVSALWDSLYKFFNGNRRQAIVHYFLTKNENFLMENSDVLEFDADGEVTIASLKKALERDGEYGDLSDRLTLEHLNKEIKAGKYDYSEALDNVLKFNKQNQFNQDFMATLKREDDGKYSIEVVKRSPAAEYELADHVQNKILTDAVRLVLKDKGLSIEFLDNPSYAVQYSPSSARPDAEGLLTVASILDGRNSSAEAAEVAGHFIAASMQDSPLVQRLVNMLTPEVQSAIFKDPKSDLLREDFIVSESSAMEAAGILIGRELVSSIKNAQKTKAASVGLLLPKSVKWLLSKIGNLAKRIFGMYKPDNVKLMVDRAKEAASTAAQGFITNPDDADVSAALNNSATYVGGNISKKLSDDVRKNVLAYYDTLGSLRSMVDQLRTVVGRAESPIAKDILSKLRTLTSGIHANYSPQMSMETFAENASIAGIVVALEGITQILDTDIRSLLDQIQPSDRAESYTKIPSNARNMMTVNSAIKNIAELYLTMQNKLDTLKASDRVQFPDADNNQVVTTLREAVKRLGDVLVGNDETYTDTKGIERQVNGIQKIMELKRKQIFIDAIGDFFGSKFVEMNAGKVWERQGWKFRLKKSNNRKVEVQDLIDTLEEDISWFDRYLSSAADCADFVTAVGNKVTKNANMNADRIASRFWDRIEGLELQMKDAFGHTNCSILFEEIVDAEGHRTKTGNLISQVNYGEWENARHEFAQQLKKDFNDHLAEVKRRAYEANKNVEGYVFSLSDKIRGILYHNFVDPQWKKWHEENSEEDKSVPGRKRFVPNHIKYHNTQWDELFDTSNPGLSPREVQERTKRLKWYNALMELKDEMDTLLPQNATVRWRAPQMTGRFSHRFKNLKRQMGNSRAAFGNALRRKCQDLWTVRPDEAYLFGSNNEFNEIEEDPLENAAWFEKDSLNRIPLYGINKLKNMEDLSTDLFGTLLEYGSMAATYKAMEQVVDVFELGKDVLKQRKLGWVKGKQSESQNDNGSTRAYTRYIKFVEKQIYGLGVTPPSFDRKGVIRKIANNLSSLGGRILLAGNLHGGIVNTGTGMMEIYKEALSGENFTMSEVNKAHKMYFNGLLTDPEGGFWSTMGNGLINTQRPMDKNSLWIRHWNILSENRSFLHNQRYDTKAMSLLDNRLGEWFGHTMMLPYSSGDHYMQTIPYYSMGIHQKVYDHNGNEMTLMDAYNIVDGEEVFAADDKNRSGESLGRTPKKLKLKEGIFRSAADIISYDTVIGMLDRIDRYFQNNPGVNGNVTVALDMFSDSEKAYMSEEGFAVPQNVKQLETLRNALRLKSHDLVFNEDDESAFMDKCRNICNRLHGIYNSEDKVAFQQNFYGSLVTSMRGYALGMINRRYANSKYNVAQGKVVEGNYNTAFKVLASAFYDINNMDNWKAVGEAMLLTIPVAGVFALYNKGYGERLKADMVKAGFSEHQYYNMRRTGADFLVIEALMLLKFLSSPGRHFGLGGFDDEDKVDSNDTSENLLAGLIYYFTNRWDREQEAFNTPRGMWNEATSVLDYIPVGFSGAKAIWDIAALFAETQFDKIGGNPDLSDSDLYYQSSKDGKYEAGDEKWKVQFKRLCPYIRSWYTFTHPYDAAAGFEYGRRIRGK